jgi:hypothetical protein
MKPATAKAMWARRNTKAAANTPFPDTAVAVDTLAAAMVAAAVTTKEQ